MASGYESVSVRTAPVMRQVWRHLGFLHWPVDPPWWRAAPAARPGGRHVRRRRVRGRRAVHDPADAHALGGLPIAPAFHELNVRTYVHRDGRDPGVWFFSLDAASRLAVAGARVAYGLPYFHARMSMEVGAGEGGATGASTTTPAAARVRRRDVPPAATTPPARRGRRPRHARVLPGRALPAVRVDRPPLRTARVAHAAYPLQPAVARGVAQTLTDAARLPSDAFAAPPPAGPLRARGRRRDIRPLAPLTLTSKPPSDR